MGTITLDDRDRAVLEHLREGDADVETLADHVNCSQSSLRHRLPELADNGLVLRVHDDVYTITANGKRTLAASGDGTEDERLDTPPDVERKIASFDLRPDREEAVRNAFAFLQYWGSATEGEMIDGVYSENPAGFESSARWWDECVRDRLADLPSVDPPGSSGLEWEYAETSMVDQPTSDGRDADDGTTQTSARYALESTDLNAEEREAVRAAFDVLVHEGDANADELKERIYPDHDAGYDSPDAWWDECVRETFESLPGVEQTNAGRDLWEYEQSLQDPVTGGPVGGSPDDGAGHGDADDG